MNVIVVRAVRDGSMLYIPQRHISFFCESTALDGGSFVFLGEDRFEVYESPENIKEQMERLSNHPPAPEGKI